MRRLIALIVAGTWALFSAVGAGAEASPGYGGGVQGPSLEHPDPIVWADSLTSVPNHRGAGGPRIVCTLNAPVAAGDSYGPGPVVTDPVEGDPYFLVCVDQDGNHVTVREITYSPAAVIDTATLARYAARELPLLYPVPSTAPPRDGTQLVGVRTWLWVDPQDLVDVVGTASVPGIVVTARAHPESVTWDMGDGTPPVDCAGAGTAYDPDVPDADQHTDCWHAFTAAGTYAVTVSIRWHVTWIATNGAGGDLGIVERGVTFPVTVESRQAVIDG